MTDEENIGVEEQTSTALDEANESESVSEALQEPPTKQKGYKNNAPEYNWAELKRAKQESDRRIKELEDTVNRYQKPPAEVEEDFRYDKDALPTFSEVEKLIEKRAAKLAEQVVRQRENATVDDRLSAKFNDFAEVVSKENIELLKETEPELAQSLWRLQDDPYAQGVAAYKLMKKLGIGMKEPTSPEKEKAIKNSQKPVSVNAVTKQSAIGNAHLFENGLTPELKKSLWKEMQDAKKRG